MTTGWPFGLLQDDERKLSRWLASRPDALYQLRKNMTQDDIIRMAKEAGFAVNEKARQHQPNCIFHTQYMVDELLERFAKLVRAAEKEACAKVCDDMAVEWQKYITTPSGTIAACSAAIRSRGQA